MGLFLNADDYEDEDGYAINLSGVSSLQFMGSNSFDVDGSGALDSDNILLPSGFRITGNLPSYSFGADITYQVENVAVYRITSSTITFPSTAAQDIVVDSSVSALTISNTMTSQSGKIDFSSYNDALTLNGATLTADNYGQSEGYSIDLSGVSMLTVTGSNDINVDRAGAIDSNTKILMPSGFDIRDGGSGEINYDVGDSDVEYAIRDGDHTIIANIIYPASATGGYYIFDECFNCIC